jgi:hypothetical protein
MSILSWIQYSEKMVGQNHPSLADTLNRSLRALLTASGYDPDADIGNGFAKGTHTHPATQITSGTFPGTYAFGGSITFAQVIATILSLSADLANYPRTANTNLSAGFTAFDCTTGAKTATLPNAALQDGTIYIVKKIDATANALILSGTLGGIDGVSTKSVTTQYARIMVISAGGHWQQII